MAELDWDALAAEAKTAGVIAAGEYNLVVAESSATTSSTGKPMIKVKMRVMDGPQKDKPVWTQFVISPESPMALRMFFQNMAAYGLDASFFANKPSMEDVARALLNRAVTARLGIRQWQGADRNDVEAVKALSASGPTPPGVVTGPPTVGVSPVSGAAPSPVQPTPSATPPVPTDAAPTATPTAPPNRPF